MQQDKYKNGNRMPEETLEDSLQLSPPTLV